MPHLREHLDYTVEVLIVNQDRVLLRRHDKYKFWLGAGGHIEPNEDPNEAAYREVREETGLEIKLIAPRPMPGSYQEAGKRDLVAPWYINRHRISETHEHVAFVYFATTDSTDIKPQHEGDRSDDCIWATRGELDGLGLKEDILYYAQQALNAART